MKHIMIVALVLLANLNVFAQTYRWVDENGQVNYGSNPPKSGGSERIKVKLPKLNDSEARLSKADAEKNDKQKEQAALDREAQIKTNKENEQIKTACMNMRKDLALYRSQPMARVNVDGEARRLTEEELNERISNLEKSININCQSF